MNNTTDNSKNKLEIKIVETYTPILQCHTDPASLPKDIRLKLLKARDALVVGDIDEAYHQLYSIASPEFSSLDPWVKLEGREE